MKFTFDHDLHLHSKLSLCSECGLQTNERILQYAQENGLHTIALANHFWDEKVDGCGGYGYEIQNYPYICKAKPLPQSDDVHFLFACETEMSKDYVLGLSKERMKEFDFIVIPTTHLHFRNFTLAEEDDTVQGRAKAWVDRFDAVLNMELPFHKIGIAHLTSGCMVKFMWDNRFDPHTRLLEILQAIPSEDMQRLFRKASKLGVGIELHAGCMSVVNNENKDVILRPYQIAKECGCKFYCGTDAHKPCEFEIAKHLATGIDLLGLEEKDKFDVKSLWKK